MDIEGCYQFLLSRNNTGGVIVRFVNRKHSEDILQLKNHKLP